MRFPRCCFHSFTLAFLGGVSLAASSCRVARAQGNEITFQLQDNLIRVPVVIDGNKIDAVLDSGTGSFGVDSVFAADLGLRPGAEAGKIPGGGAAIPFFPVQLAKVEFGPERLSGIAGGMGGYEYGRMPLRFYMELPADVITYAMAGGAYWLTKAVNSHCATCEYNPSPLGAVRP